MESRQLRNRLRALGKEANRQFPYLNNGGCCVYAAAVAGELERLGYEYEVIVPAPYNETLDLSDVRKNVTNVNEKSSWNAAGVYFSHVAVRVKTGGRWYTYDSDGFRRSKYEFGRGWSGDAMYTAPNGGMTAKEAKSLADESKGWNSCFHRGDVPRVRKLVKEMLA